MLVSLLWLLQCDNGNDPRLWPLFDVRPLLLRCSYRFNCFSLFFIVNTKYKYMYICFLSLNTKIQLLVLLFSIFKHQIQVLFNCFLSLNTKYRFYCFLLFSIFNTKMQLQLFSIFKHQNTGTCLINFNLLTPKYRWFSNCWCYFHLKWCYLHLRWCYLHLRWCYLRRWLGCSIDFAFSA